MISAHCMKNSSGSMLMTGSVTGSKSQSSLLNVILWKSRNSVLKSISANIPTTAGRTTVIMAQFLRNLSSPSFALMINDITTNSRLIAPAR